MLPAIAGQWPEAELQQCEWHLQRAVERLLAKELRRSPSDELEELRGRAEGALISPSFWRPFVRAARAAENESLDRWIAVNGPTIEAQFARRPPPSRRPVDMPLTTSALEQITRPIVTALYPRRYALKNCERLNRLPMLQQLHINGDDDVQAYAKTTRAWLEATAAARRRAGARSLTVLAHPACADLSPIRCERGLDQPEVVTTDAVAGLIAAWCRTAPPRPRHDPHAHRNASPKDASPQTSCGAGKTSPPHLPHKPRVRTL